MRVSEGLSVKTFVVIAVFFTVSVVVILASSWGRGESIAFADYVLYEDDPETWNQLCASERAPFRAGDVIALSDALLLNGVYRCLDPEGCSFPLASDVNAVCDGVR